MDKEELNNIKKNVITKRVQFVDVIKCKVCSKETTYAICPDCNLKGLAEVQKRTLTLIDLIEEFYYNNSHRLNSTEKASFERTIGIIKNNKEDKTQ